MKDSTKQGWWRAGLGISTLCFYASLMGSLVFKNDGHLFTFGLVATAVSMTVCLLQMFAIERRQPAKVPTHTLPKNLAEPPSFDIVSMPNNGELWRSLLVMTCVMVVTFGALGLWLIPDYVALSYRYLMVGMVAVYLHESFQGPHRRLFWIAYVIGEWRGQSWRGPATATVLYVIAFGQTPPAYRLGSFFGGVSPFYFYWMEVRVTAPMVDIVSYVWVPKTLYRTLKSGDQLQVEYRESRLDPSRLQVRLAN